VALKALLDVHGRIFKFWRTFLKKLKNVEKIKKTFKTLKNVAKIKKNVNIVFLHLWQ